MANNKPSIGIDCVFVCLSLLTVTAQFCCGEVVELPGCHAHRERLVVVCRGLNASALPTQLTKELSHTTTQGRAPRPWVRELQILSGRLPVLDSIIPEGVLNFHLHILQVIRCQVRQVTVEAMLQVATTLRHLSLSHNKLVAVPAAVSLLWKLETLDLKHNAITSLSPLLAKIPNLRTLKLDHNRIRVVSGWSTAAPHRHLSHLGLADNFVHEVWLQALTSLPALQWLDLSRNLLQRLPQDLVLPPTLLELDLRGNPWHCDCSAAWLPLLKHRSIVTHLPQCTSPQPLRRHPLQALTVAELCSGLDRLNGTLWSPKDLTNQHMQLVNISSRSFDLFWNVSDISHRGKRVQEYLGWRVTFRKFGDAEESEVFLITLAGEDASRKTGTSIGQYTIQNLTPDTAYQVCIDTLTDGEVNNIIDTENSNVDAVTNPTTLPQHQINENLKSRSINPDFDISDTEHPLNHIFLKEWESYWGEKLKQTTEKITTEIPTTEISTTEMPITTPSIRDSNFNIPISAQQFVYTNTGDKIPINFGPVIPINNNQNDFFSSFNFQNDPNIIRNVPPPPPPTNFGESGDRFPFPLVRKKRSYEYSKNKDETARCIEVHTLEEDEFTVPVTVAATASSSTTMVILFICCCCCPKRCNKMRDCCTNKCKSMTKNNIIKSNSKTRVFVKPSENKQKLFDKSASSPDLRSLALYNSLENYYHYPKLNKYYTIRPKDLDNFTIESFPGYDLPKSATAKLYGYDFPRITSLNSSRRLSTDDNMSPTENDRFHYYNLNKFKANLNIPIEQCKYSEKIKVLNYHCPPTMVSELHDYQTPPPGIPRKVSNNEYNIRMPGQSLLKTNYISRSTPDLYSKILPKSHNKIHLQEKFNYIGHGISTQNNPGYDFSSERIKRENLRQRNLSKSTEAKLEIVRHIDRPKPMKPIILTINPHNEQQPNISYPITNKQNNNNNHTNTMQEPYAGNTHTKHVPTHGYKPTTTTVVNAPPVPLGEVAVSGGTLVEVPEGYVLPAKPRPINVLTLKVPADSFA